MTEPLIDLLTGRPVEKWAQEAAERSTARRSDEAAPMREDEAVAQKVDPLFPPKEPPSFICQCFPVIKGRLPSKDDAAG